MKILLAGINARFSHVNTALYYLKSYVKDIGADVSILESNINQGIDKILSVFGESDYDAIAFSVYIWNSSIIKKIIPAIKEMKPVVKIILGGPDVSYNPDTWLSDIEGIDFIVKGAGEAGFRHLIESDLKCNDKIIALPNPPFNEIPFPYEEEDIKKFSGRYIYYESSRGCPFRCSYCVSSREDQALQFRPFDRVACELDFMAGVQGINVIKFVDRTFNCSRAHYRRIWEHIVLRFKNSGLKFHFEIHPGLLDEDDFKLLDNVPPDFFQFEIGVQSVHTETLAAVNRPADWNKIKANIKRLVDIAKIRIHLDLIAGLPFEDLEKLKFSFDEVYSLKPDYLQLGLLKILPGTDISYKANEFGIRYDTAQPYAVIKTGWLSEEEIESIIKISALVNLFYNTGGFKTVLELLLELYGSPFSMFRAFSASAENMLHTKSWEYGAGLILEFIRKIHPDKISLFIDALRWDWCGLPRQGGYPPILRSDFTWKLKKEAYKYFNTSVGHRNAGESTVLQKEVLKGAMFFSPESREFAERFMNGNNFALFFNVGRVRFYNIQSLS